MKWVQVNRAHFNTALICSFYWSGGKLFVYFVGEDEPDYYDDPKRENYLRLCRTLGVRPLEDDACG